MRNLRDILIGISLCCAVWAHAQVPMDSVFILPDSSRAFTLQNFYELILQNHPVAKQINLMSDVARQEIRLARGNFDPKIEASFLNKNFKDTEYYNIFNAELKIPTQLPFDPKIGIDRNKGRYLNPERTIPDDFDFRQVYAGFSLPLGRGLFTDDRRAALQQAQLFQQLTTAEQVKLSNKFLLEAAKDYWNWFYSYYHYRLFNRSVAIAHNIFERVKVSCELGEVAPIDTVQAKITWQERQVEMQEAFLDFQNSGILLSNYLWDSVGNPSALDLRWAPAYSPIDAALSLTTLEQLSAQARENHPELRKIRIKLEQLDVDRRLAVENIKPRIDLNYSFINQPFDPEWNTGFDLGEDYKFGVDFSFPLFIRKERAKLAMTKLKISNTQLEQDLAERQILNEIQSVFNELTNNQIVLEQQDAMVDNYSRLLNAELLNVENGESDLFKLNVQTEKLIQSQTKLLKVMADIEKQKATLYWAAGVQNLNP